MFIKPPDLLHEYPAAPPGLHHQGPAAPTTAFVVRAQRSRLTAVHAFLDTSCSRVNTFTSLQSSKRPGARSPTKRNVLPRKGKRLANPPRAAAPQMYGEQFDCSLNLLVEHSQTHRDQHTMCAAPNIYLTYVCMALGTHAWSHGGWVDALVGALLPTKDTHQPARLAGSQGGVL